MFVYFIHNNFSYDGFLESFAEFLPHPLPHYDVAWEVTSDYTCVVCEEVRLFAYSEYAWEFRKLFGQIVATNRWTKYIIIVFLIPENICIV